MVCAQGSLGDVVTNVHYVLEFCNFNGPKIFFNSTQFIQGISEQIKPLQLVGQAAEFKFESKF